MKVERLDYGAIKRGTPTTQGGLRFQAFPTRAGVLVYRNPDGSVRRELRHPDDVFKPESLATLAHATLTDRHPEGRVDTHNYRSLNIGHVAENVRKSDEVANHVVCDVIVNDAEAIRKIDNGERIELSCGYTCDLLDEQGEFEGERYDARQVGHVYNHLALLGPGEARGGATCALRIDGKDVRIDGLVVDASGMPKHDPAAAVPLIQNALRVLSGHPIEVRMGSGENVPMQMADANVARATRGAVQTRLIRGVSVPVRA